jgi:hypothetical protein
VIVYVLGVDAARSIAPVFASITSPAGNAENVPPTAPVVVNVVVPVAQKFLHSLLLSDYLIQSLAK